MSRLHGLGLAALVVLLQGALPATAVDLGRPDAHAPMVVMGDHTHNAGEVMLSYRYMRMDMEGSRTSAHRVGEGRVLQDFPITPTKMDMEMHMFGVMWAPSDRITVVGMLPLLRFDMDHVTRMGATFTALSGHRLGLEFVYPVHQWLDGPQLESDWLFVLGWQKTFYPNGS